jgi:hypothetical protein
VDVLLGEHGRGQLGPPGLGHEDLARLVDPDLLDVRVVEERLERAHADHPVGHRLGHLPGVGDRRHAGHQPPVGVVGDDLVDELAHGDRVAAARVKPRRRTSSRTSSSTIWSAVGCPVAVIASTRWPRWHGR